MSEIRLSRAQLHVMQHALGHLRGERNHFCTGPGTKDWEDCLALVEAGLMVNRGGNAILPARDSTFSVNSAGARYAFDYEMLNPKQLRLVRKLTQPFDQEVSA